MDRFWSRPWLMPGQWLIFLCFLFGILVYGSVASPKADSVLRIGNIELIELAIGGETVRNAIVVGLTLQWH